MFVYFDSIIQYLIVFYCFFFQKKNIRFLKSNQIQLNVFFFVQNWTKLIWMTTMSTKTMKMCQIVNMAMFLALKMTIRAKQMKDSLEKLEKFVVNFETLV